MTVVCVSGVLKYTEDDASHVVQSVVHNLELYLELCLASAKLDHRDKYCEADKE